MDRASACDMQQQASKQACLLLYRLRSYNPKCTIAGPFHPQPCDGTRRIPINALAPTDAGMPLMDRLGCHSHVLHC